VIYNCAISESLGGNKMAKNPRIPITITKEMKDYFEKESLRTGLSQSTLIFMIVSKEFEKIKGKE